MPSPSTALRALALVLLLAALGWLVWARPDDLAAIPGHLARLPAKAWLGVFALTLLSYALRFLRWHLLLTHLGHRIPLGRQALIYLAGFGLAMTPGKLGETVRSAYLVPLGVPLGHSLAAFFTERLADLLIVSLLASLALAPLLAHPVWFGVVWAGLLALLALLRSRLLPGLARRLGRGTLAHTADGGAHALHHLLRGRMLCLSLLLGGLAWAGQGLGLWLLLATGGAAPPPWPTVGSYALSLLAGALSFVPGGLGVTEGTLLWLLQQQGMGITQAATAALIGRGVPLWLGVLAGLVALAVLGSSRRLGTRP